MNFSSDNGPAISEGDAKTKFREAGSEKTKNYRAFLLETSFPGQDGAQPRLRQGGSPSQAVHPQRRALDGIVKGMRADRCSSAARALSELSLRSLCDAATAEGVSGRRLQDSAERPS